MISVYGVLRHIATTLLVAILLTNFSFASAAPLFYSDDVLEFSLAGPFGSLVAEKNQETDRAFVFSANGVEQLVSVRVRGNSRKVVCSFPPLRLDFDENEAGRALLAGQDRLKLVTHCTDRESGAANVLEEYAAYKIFNLISELSFRVRLARITYLDSDGEFGREPFERYGILIESASELADRVGGQAVDLAGVTLGSLDARQAARVFVFQYLIANTDWSLVAAENEDTCCHNVDLFRVGSDLHILPYDFDRSGLVNARYAKPDSALRISRVTQRLYRGYCISVEPIAEALGEINSLQANIVGEIRRIPGFTRKDTDKAVKFVDRFFAQAQDEKRLLRLFERQCIG